MFSSASAACTIRASASSTAAWSRAARRSASTRALLELDLVRDAQDLERLADVAGEAFTPTTFLSPFSIATW